MKSIVKLWLLVGAVLGFGGAAYATATLVTTQSGQTFALRWCQLANGDKCQATVLINPRDESLVPVDPCQGGAKTSKPILYTAAGSTTLVAGSPGKLIYICSAFMFTSAANPTAVVEGSGANCATNTIGVIGGATTVNGINFTGNQGFTLGNGSSFVAATSTLGNDLCVITSQSAILAGVITTAIQ